MIDVNAAVSSTVKIASDADSTRRVYRASDRSTCRTNARANPRTSSDTSGLAAAFIRTGGFSRFFTCFDVLLRRLVPHRLQVCVRIQDRFRS